MQFSAGGTQQCFLHQELFSALQHDDPDPDTSLLSSSDFHCSEYRRKYATEDPGMQFSDISKQVCFLFISKQVELLVDGAVGGVHCPC